MNLKFIAADTLQKIIVLVVLAIWSRTSARGSLEWSITLFSLSSLPNTLVMGIPLLKGIGARLLIAEQFPDTAGSIISFKVDSDIISLDGKEPLQTDAELGSSSTTELHPKAGAHAETKPTAMPPASVMTRLILIMVWRKLIRNPNTYSSLIGLTWSLVSFKWGIQMPTIIAPSIAILSDAGLGMAMFSLGLFMALQPRIIACGNTIATFAMAVRFLTGPAVMAAASIAVGLRGVLLRIAIVQAALPQGIVPFVFAKEYNVHPDILSTACVGHIWNADCPTNNTGLLHLAWTLKKNSRGEPG
ncbi:hypothetical protein REPUB_Repub06bG0107400 [Reevesia pubescens]